MASDISTEALPCYYANGTVSSSDVRCNPDGKTSTCCAPGWQCVNNLYCKRSGVDKPGSCTDENWNQRVNPACSCPPKNNTQDYLSNTILCSGDAFLCVSNGDNEDHRASDCFDTDIPLNPIIDYGNGLGVPTSTDANALAAYYSGLAVSTTMIPPRTVTIESSGSSGTPSAASISAGPTSTAAAESGLSGSAKIGLGVGVGVGVPLLLILATILFLLLRRKGSNHREGDGVSMMKSIPSSPAPAYKAVSQQEIPVELSTEHAALSEMSSVKSPSELQASALGIDNGYRNGR